MTARRSPPKLPQIGWESRSQVERINDARLLLRDTGLMSDEEHKSLLQRMAARGIPMLNFGEQEPTS